ncbi:MAG: formyltransferase family protein, partial [Gammaproteobacteria bacterium]
MTKPKIAILISGRGSNMVAILDAIREGRLDAEAALVISNIETAAGVVKASERGVETLVISHKGRAREDHDREIVAELKRRDVGLV